MLSLGRSPTALRVLDSFWGSWDTTGDSSPVLLTSLNRWSPCPARMSLSFGVRPLLHHSQTYVMHLSGHQYCLFLDTDASNFGLGGVLSQIQNNVECIIAYCSRTLRPSQRKYCTTKRERYRGFDGSLVTYSTTVLVLYCTPRR